ncbi:MAG: peptide synthetase, partial [Rhodobacteraceae bacterium]
MNMMTQNKFSCIVIGAESLLIHCSEMILSQGHSIAAVVSDRADIIAWAQRKNLQVIAPKKGLAQRLAGIKFDWLFSLANLDIIPSAVLDMPTKGAINFHDGLLPDYAGLNTPAWALINQEIQHGISWHMIEGGVDEGDILAQSSFDITPHDTSLTLNTKCFEAALDSFPNLLEQIATNGLQRQTQSLPHRHYCALADRPASFGLIDFSKSATEISALMRGLNFGGYWNPLCVAKFAIKGQFFAVSDVTVETETTEKMASGIVVAVSETSLRVTTGSYDITLSGFADLDGKTALVHPIAAVGDSFDAPNLDDLKTLAALSAQDSEMRKRLADFTPLELPFVNASQALTDYQEKPFNVPKDVDAATVIALWASRLSGTTCFDIKLSSTPQSPLSSGWVPVRFDANTGENLGQTQADFTVNLQTASQQKSFMRDLTMRDNTLNLDKNTDLEITLHKALSGSAPLIFNLANKTLSWDKNAVDEAGLNIALTQLSALATSLQSASPDSDITQLSMLSDEDRHALLHADNQTQTNVDLSQSMHCAFEQQVKQTPDATAVVFEDKSLTYAQLNTRANQVAHVLCDLGVKAETLVGLHTARSLDLVIGAIAIHKAGGAYVPMDPTYPADRIAHFINDSQAAVIISQSDLAQDLPAHNAKLLVIDSDDRIAHAPRKNLEVQSTPDALAYLIYTSGSTGLPKGVMVQHNNVANFFAGMDARIIRTGGQDTWLAVTSLSFDISVLELFYTLARGFKVVISSDESRVMTSGSAQMQTNGGIDFSLFNWGNDDQVGDHKYQLMLDSAKFADANGFCAVWTPERHFHAFGGSFPNPAVTGAAIAAVTKNLAVRAGSIVAPLHHPARIAEEWAVVDNLTQGRTGLAIASGWQPDDFVLRPENTPPNNKPATLETITTLRKLWAGEAVAFPKKNGDMFDVITQPRPISKTLPLWVTSAGNPETWKEAGRLGANVLTHLLGQSLDEVAGKIKIYHAELRDAGYDPDDFTVTLMLHTLVGDDREVVRDMAREPMKDYLRAAAGLIKQYAWAFPAFKRPKGTKSAFDLSLDGVSDEDLEAILDFAFERYFEDAGLFGTIEDCLEKVQAIKAIGVGEIACLIDYGLSVPDVLAGLKPLAEVLRIANPDTDQNDQDYSLAALIKRHNVTHFQATPSMARMLLADDTATASLAGLKQILVGGEALPGAMVEAFNAHTNAPIENMYGPTETTIWSSTETAAPVQGLVNIGKAIANTQLYVLDAQNQPCPIGVAGELYIGGLGVT